MKNGIFEPGDKIVWVTANNRALRGTVMMEYTDDEPTALEPGAIRVAVSYITETGFKSNAAPFKARVGLIPDNFENSRFFSPG